MAPISRGGAPESASWRPLRPRPPATPPSGNPAKAAYGRPNREQTAMARGADFLSFDGKCQDKVGPERVNEEAFRPNLSEGDAAGLSGSLVLAVGCSFSLAPKSHRFWRSPLSKWNRRALLLFRSLSPHGRNQ